MSNKTILLTGASGQLGKTLQMLWPESGLAHEFELHPFSRTELDITNLESVNECFAELAPSVVINCSAYTAVDKAESDEENAYLVNETGPRYLAQCCRQQNARLIHISTDFVFSGAFEKPIQPSEATEPAGVYGRSKRAGELAIQDLLSDNSIIFRTSWLYSPFNANFVKTMLRLMKERDSLGVVADQRGAPTSTLGLVKAIFKALEAPTLTGIYHWSDLADISWFDFSMAIQESGLAEGLLEKAIPINPIATSNYPTPAQRPAYSVLDCSAAVTDLGLVQFDWKLKLNEVIKEIKNLNEQEKLGA